MTKYTMQLMRRFKGSHSGTPEDSNPLRHDTMSWANNLTTRRHIPKKVNLDKQNLFENQLSYKVTAKSN
jgi:hypothetical protein